MEGRLIREVNLIRLTVQPGERLLFTLPADTDDTTLFRFAESIRAAGITRGVVIAADVDITVVQEVDVPPPPPAPTEPDGGEGA